MVKFITDVDITGKDASMFEIDMKSRLSIYEQVVGSVKELILAGVLRENEKLPSVRDLSAQLTVNPNTVGKAFRELERQGYIYTVSGVGSFVSGREDRERDEKLISGIKANIEDSLRELRYALGDDIAFAAMADGIVEHMKGELAK